MPCGFWHLCAVWMRNPCKISFPVSKCIHYLSMGVPPFQKRNLGWTVEEPPPASRPSQKRELICVSPSRWLVWWTIVILHSAHCFKFLSGRASPLLQWRDEKLHNGYADGQETAHANVNLQSGLPAWRQMIQWQCWAHSLKMLVWL